MAYTRTFEPIARLEPPAPLGESDVHVWCIPLEIAADTGRGVGRLLSADERSRAERFRFDRDRRRYVAARSALRILLGHYGERDAAGIAFGYSTRGKPFLPSTHSARELQFNVSHSGEIALMAFCQGAQLGVDVELVRDIDDAESIVRRYFCREEVEQWTELPAGQRSRAFYDCWTRKEALVKALGDGLSLPLDVFQVSFLPGELPGIRFREPGKGQWSLYDVSPASGYAGAVAVSGSGWDVRCWLASTGWSES